MRGREGVEEGSSSLRLRGVAGNDGPTGCSEGFHVRLNAWKKKMPATIQGRASGGERRQSLGGCVALFAFLCEKKTDAKGEGHVKSSGRKCVAGGGREWDIVRKSA